MIGWPGVSASNGYKLDPLMSNCFFLKRLAITVRWSDIETKYGMFTAQMSTIFGEMVERFVNVFGYALELNGDRLRQRAALCANAFHAAGSPLPLCVGFIDDTKIRI